MCGDNSAGTQHRDATLTSRFTARVRLATGSRLTAFHHDVLLGIRVRRYRSLSSNKGAYVGTTVVTPVLAIGPGTIRAHGAQFGYIPSPSAYDRYTHLEARGTAKIEIGAGSILNNACVIVADGTEIRLGRDVVVGPEVAIYDSDFHSLTPSRRKSGPAAMAPVLIGDNVFIGTRSTILKGVTIGENSVIGSGSVVTRDVPPNVIAAGNPCRVVRALDIEAAEETSG